VVEAAFVREATKKRGRIRVASKVHTQAGVSVISFEPRYVRVMKRFALCTCTVIATFFTHAKHGSVAATSHKIVCPRARTNQR
jgi:hypothetical protein